MARSIRQEDHLKALVERLDLVTRRAEGLRDTLSSGQLAWRPPRGGWGVDQVLHHLVTSNSAYFPGLETLIASAPRPPRPADLTWRPSVIGNFMAKALRSPRRLPAPRPWQPGPTVPDGVLTAFLTAQVRLRQLVERTSSLSWQTSRIRSPVSGLLRFNLGDALTILVIHEERHFGQIDRVRAHPAFPS